MAVMGGCLYPMTCSIFYERLHSLTNPLLGFLLGLKDNILSSTHPSTANMGMYT